jgi:uncharacterized protein with PQ loop repeat
MVNALGAVAFVTAFSLFLPQAHKAWTNRRDAAALAGISVFGQWLILINQSLWTVYGLAAKAYWTVAPGVIIMPTAAFVLILLARSKRAHSAAVPASPHVAW